MNEGILETGNGLSYDLSDPVQKQAMVADNLLLYITEVGAVIREYDPTALVTVGFFAPQFPNETVIGGTWYVDTAALIEGGALLDFYDFHAYPGDDLTMAQLAEMKRSQQYWASTALLNTVTQPSRLLPGL